MRILIVEHDRRMAPARPARPPQPNSGSGGSPGSSTTATTITWAKVLADLDRVCTNPQQRAVAALQAIATVDPATDDTPFVLLPDMPAPETDSPAATLEVLAPVVVPAPQPLTVGRAWFKAVDANPFHGGLLSGLRNYT
jgi:5-methylthioadenosine/S-adenosylhomocysteine deaminase